MPVGYHSGRGGGAKLLFVEHGAPGSVVAMKRMANRLAAVALVAVGLLAYPLSVGPAEFVFQYVDWGSLKNAVASGRAVFPHFPDAH
jgi:hypothetical protein